MKKQFVAAALAGVMLLSGCSGVSQESYNLVVAENEKLKSENTSLKSGSSDTTSEETSEYCMPKENVKRIAKVLELPDKYCYNHEDTKGLKMEQYNINSTYEVWAYNSNGSNQLKCICNISTDNTPQEKAAFITYFWRLHMGEYLEKEVENGCENVVTIINDNQGVPIAVWLVYSSKGNYKHDMDIVDTNVLAAVDEVLADADTWKPKENQTTYSLPENNNSKTENNGTSTTQSTQSTSRPDTIQSVPAPIETTTTGEKNALKKAQSYLDFTAFSRDGLIGQLEFEGFTKSEATYGADNVGANWNEQAVKKAKDYLEFTAFSYSGLVEQLEFEEFTHEQAVYGADKCGANWNEQAAKKAESYLELMAFSRDSLIEQLEFEGFTHEQAVYGAAQNGY